MPLRNVEPHATFLDMLSLLPFAVIAPPMSRHLRNTAVNSQLLCTACMVWSASTGAVAFSRQFWQVGVVPSSVGISRVNVLGSQVP